jgi:hypothetical protein
LVSAVAACGGNVDAGRAASSGTTTSAAGAGGSGADGGGAGGEGGAAGGASSGVGGLDPGWTLWPGQTWPLGKCDETGLRDLTVELWPHAYVACSPPLDVVGVQMLALLDWDGSPGTFVFGEVTEHGRALAGFTGGDLQDGWLTIEPYADTPAWIEWEIEGEPGRTDLSMCGHWEKFHCDAR